MNDNAANLPQRASLMSRVNALLQTTLPVGGSLLAMNDNAVNLPQRVVDVAGKRAPTDNLICGRELARDER